MEYDLLIIAEKVESRKCRLHEELASIKISRRTITVSSCCDAFKKRIERKLDEEAFLYFNREEAEALR